MNKITQWCGAVICLSSFGILCHATNGWIGFSVLLMVLGSHGWFERVRPADDPWDDEE